jgi:hypothetical protein
MARYRRWNENQWREYIAKTVRLRQLVHEFFDGFPETRGLRAAHLRPFVDAHLQIEYSALGLEDVVSEHFGGDPAVPDGGAIEFVRGRARGVKDRSDTLIARIAGKAKPSDPVLSREQWQEWGDRAKEAWDLHIALIIKLQEIVSKTSRPLTAMSKVGRALYAGKCRMDSLVCAQHPDWPEATRVFYGARDDAPAGRP